MLSCLLSRTARRALLPVRHLHAGAPAAEAPVVAHSGFRPESPPRHVAVVPDGNRCWAQARGLPTADGHEAGRHAIDRTVRLSLAWGVRALTVFAFSQENSGRPKARPAGPPVPCSDQLFVSLQILCLLHCS